MNTTPFFVVGAAKAGTTSVYHYLRQHPQVHLHPFKDVACYFCQTYGMPLTRDAFVALMQPRQPRHRVSGDVCSDYLTEPAAAEEIAAFYPDAKIIAILRNPADRAFSLYQWMVREGYEYLPSFEAAIEAEDERASRKLKGMDLVSPSKSAYLYTRSGFYSSQLRRFFERFRRERLLILKYDDLLRDPAGLMRSVYTFLDVDADFTPTLEVYNRGSWPLFPSFQYFCRRRLMRPLPNRIVAPLMRLNTSLPRRTELDSRLRKRLLAGYAADIRATEKLTGLELGSWLASAG